MAHDSLFEEVITRSDPQSSEFALPDVADREYIVVERGATAAEYAKDKCVHELFAEQAAKTPYAVALIYEDQKLSYGELECRSNQLAHHLRALGVGRETVVGLCMGRSLDLVVGLLAILKAGGAYLPLDPSYPPQRLVYMTADAKVSVLVTQADSGQRASRLCRRDGAARCRSRGDRRPARDATCERGAPG